MKVGRIVRTAFLASVAVLASALLASSGSRPVASAQSPGNPHCTHVGGSIITNFGAVDANTTLGPATGDLRGAVAASLLTPPQPGPYLGPLPTVLFNIQHHWVTESGDNIYFSSAVATTVPVPNSQTRFAFVAYQTHIIGGTGKFAGATGTLDNIGEADLVAGTAIRYSGHVCFADSDDR